MDVYKTVDIPDDITVPQQRVVFRSKKVGEMWQALSAEKKEVSATSPVAHLVLRIFGLAAIQQC